jgi:hypothetical protein
MKREAVEAIARAHQEVERGRRDGELDEPALRDTEIAAARELWTRLAQECREYCDYYNAAIGVPRIFCEVHEDTIVVRSHADVQNTVTLSRTAGAFHSGMVVAHRYRYPGQAVDLPIAVHAVVGRPVTLTFEGEELPVDDFVLKLLKRYTEELVTG